MVAREAKLFHAQRPGPSWSKEIIEELSKSPPLLLHIYQANAILTGTVKLAKLEHHRSVDHPSGLASLTWPLAEELPSALLLPYGYRRSFRFHTTPSALPCSLYAPISSALLLPYGHHHPFRFHTTSSAMPCPL